jgi:hypothetical protein
MRILAGIILVALLGCHVGKQVQPPSWTINDFCGHAVEEGKLWSGLHPDKKVEISCGAPAVWTETKVLPPIFLTLDEKHRLFKAQLASRRAYDHEASVEANIMHSYGLKDWHEDMRGCVTHMIRSYEDFIYSYETDWPGCTKEGKP